MAGSVSKRNGQVEAALEILRSGTAKTISEAARATGAPRKTVSDHWNREQQERGEEAQGVVEDDDGSVSISTAPWNKDTPAPWKGRDLMKAHGYDPDDFIITKTVFNRWGDPEAPMHQLKIFATPKAALILAADMSDWEPPVFAGLREPSAGPMKFVMRGDQHAPYHEVPLHYQALLHDADTQPDLILFMGDGINSEAAGRHRPRPTRSSKVQATKVGVKSYGSILADTRHVNPHARIVVLRGNHDDWVEQRLLEQNPDLADIETAFTDIPMHSLRNLLHLDAMGIELIDVEYDRAKFEVTPHLVARHGAQSSKHAGEALLQRVARSAAQGHTHKIGFDYHTDHDDPDHGTTTHVGIQTGCMCEMVDGLGYAWQPNWQQGYVTGHAWDDGCFTVAPNVYTHGTLLTADGRRYHGTPLKSSIPEWHRGNLPS